MSTTTDAPAIQGTWNLDTTHSTIGFSVVYMGVAPFTAAFTDVAATLDDDGLRGVAQAASIDVGDENLAAHLAAPDFFDIANHPEIAFEGGALSLTGSTATVDGALVVKGNRAPVALSGSVSGPVADPWGNRKLALELAGSVDRTLLGLEWNAPLPDGGSILADEVALKATLVFVAAPEEA
jgi:polyisoprenoid-binding protein YceI